MDPVERTLALLRAELSRTPVTIVASGRDRFLDLQAGPSAEYSFRLWFYENDATGSSREISARLLGQAQPETCFWYWPFESAQFNTAEALSDAFDKSLLTLIRRPTRIVQKRGLLNWTFRLDAQLPELGWTQQYRHAVFRFGARAPSIDGRERIYSSPAVVSA
jgi:hypothetical protein